MGISFEAHLYGDALSDLFINKLSFVMHLWYHDCAWVILERIHLLIKLIKSFSFENNVAFFIRF